jgi:hypothetical protein
MAQLCRLRVVVVDPSVLPEETARTGLITA